MKSKLFITALAGSVCFLAACSGDHASTAGKDTTGNNEYHVGKDTSKVDTSKVTSGDYSASGGTKTPKDTLKKDTSKK